MKILQFVTTLFLVLSLYRACCLVSAEKIIYVAKDGSGQFSTIGAAIASIPDNSISRTIIQIKKGIYVENVVVPKIKTNVTLSGFGMDKTILTGHRSNSTGFRTDDTATVDVFGDGFLAMDITFENTAGPKGYQAVALKSQAVSTFYRCRFLGFQDTLYAKRKNQFYRDCEVYGTVDFIFGDASAVFQNCRIFARKPLPGQMNTITAQGRINSTSDGGTIFHNCTIGASKGLQPYQSSVKTYFGRPWKLYSRVVIMQSYIDKLIDPQGWLQWDKTRPLDKVYYAEYDNQGFGAVTKRRVNWPGRILLNTSHQASPFTVRNFIHGDKWIPHNIPRYLDLI